MGEMADYIINGDDCQYCGEYMGEGDGYPRSCAGCQDDEKDKKSPSKVQSVIEIGLTYLKTAAIHLHESGKIKKARGLANMCDQISKFSEALK